MKIALVSPYDWLTPGGVNNHIDRAARNYAERGHDVHIVAPASGPVDDPRVYVAGRPTSVPASGSVARIALDPFVGWRVSEYLGQHRFEVVHVHEPLMPTLPIHALRHSRTANPNVVNVGTFHAHRENGNRLYGYGRRLLKRWYSELDGKIAVSPPAARFVSAYFRGFYNIIPNGVDLERWNHPSIRPIPEFDDGMLNILYVGRAEKRKGLDVLLRAFAMVNARQWNTRLLVVGPDSRRRRRLRAQVEQHNQRGVVFIDSPTDAELPRWHRTAHVFCSPATGNESQGIVLLEAMAAGLPVVASNIDGYASVITHGADGILVRPQDSMSLANALSALVRDADARAALGQGGQLRAQSYSWERVTQRILSYYERLIEEKQDLSGALARRRVAVKP
ncbi:MAG: glycosyltransferase family 4 protein [Dehalococcoidia bacterium]|nr:glycosyltransferase family 4 protein [Dehalococcoidia bacterium]